MRITLKQLRHLDVETISGQELGHVADVVFEIDGQLVAQYIVKMSKWSTKNYIVNRDQVVRFEEYKMVVVDAVVPEEVKEEHTKKVLPDAEPVAMRDEA